MSSLTSVILALLLSLTSVAPVNADRSYCLHTDEVHDIATDYGSLITSLYTVKMAENVLAPNFTLYSTSEHALLDRYDPGNPSATTPMAPLYRNRTSFVRRNRAQVFWDFKQLNLWHACDTITIRYQVKIGMPSNFQDIVGMTTMSTSPAPEGHSYGHWIQSVYSEYDVSSYEAFMRHDHHHNGTHRTVPLRTPPTKDGR